MRGLTSVHLLGLFCVRLIHCKKKLSNKFTDSSHRVTDNDTGLTGPQRGCALGRGIGGASVTGSQSWADSTPYPPTPSPELR